MQRAVGEITLGVDTDDCPHVEVSSRCLGGGLFEQRGLSDAGFAPQAKRSTATGRSRRKQTCELAGDFVASDEQ